MGENIELGAGPEFDLIRQIRERLGSEGSTSAGGRPEGVIERSIAIASGDDAAVTVPSGATATSVDAAVEGVHFERATAPPSAIGHKALASALSDLAAMGAAPGEAYVVLGVPEGFDADETLEICDGMADLAQSVGVRILGGDLTRAPVVFLAVTVVGHASRASELVSRAGARAGSSVVVTGELGGAAAGRLLLGTPELADALAGPDEAEALRERQLRPLPRIAAGIELARVGAEAMIDLSDGLGSDAAHLAAAGAVGLRVELGRLPLQPGVEALAGAAGIDPLDLAVGGGEDYELLAVLPDARLGSAAAALGELGIALTSIGEVASGSSLELRGPDGALRDPGGFDHFGP